MFREKGFSPELTRVRLPALSSRPFRFAEKPAMPRKGVRLAAARALRHDRENGINGRESNRGIDREASMKRVLSGVFASVLAVAATAAFAQSKPLLKLGGILDMSGLYADITGPGSEMAAKMAVGDFGGEVVRRQIEVRAADHPNNAVLPASNAPYMLDNQGVAMTFYVVSPPPTPVALLR